MRVPELAKVLETSEATIRCDLLRQGTQVHGGATAVHQLEPRQEKYSHNIEDKRTIAAYAATLVQKGTFCPL